VNGEKKGEEGERGEKRGDEGKEGGRNFRIRTARYRYWY